MQVPIRKNPSSAPIDPTASGPLFLTQEGKEILERELARLKKEHPSAAEEVARTGQFGDFSENAEYQAAKGRLRHILFRMEQLTDMLKRATLIATESNSRVQLGSRVTVKSEDGKEKTFMLTGPAEADPMHGRLSHLSPLGAALLGQAVGNQVAVDAPNGRITYTIISLA